MRQRIVRQAIQYIGGPRPITRAWSEWNDGSYSHSDSVTTTHETRDGHTLFGYMYVNIGRDEDMTPPQGLKWVETATLRTASDAAHEATLPATLAHLDATGAEPLPDDTWATPLRCAWHDFTITGAMPGTVSGSTAQTPDGRTLRVERYMSGRYRPSIDGEAWLGDGGTMNEAKAAAENRALGKVGA